ncbi:MAG: hypothetical protein WC675_02780 [Patescibacteria group bacterium]|jgi:hypothetical protein
MPQNFKKIIDLINRTGDNCIVLDESGEPSHVIVTFKNYQNLVLGKSELVGLSEDELLEKINRDIAIWKINQEAENLDNWPTIKSKVKEDKNPSSNSPLNFDKNLLNRAKNQPEEGEEEQNYYFEPID